MRPVSRARHDLAALLFCGVAAVYVYVAWAQDEFTPAQMNAATAALQRRDPSLFGHDAVFGPDRLGRFETPAFQALLELLLVPTGYEDVTLGFRVLAPLLTLIYLGGMYALLYRQCGSWSIAAFVAILSLRVTAAPGGVQWGVGPAATVTAAGVALALVPALVLLFLRTRTSRRVLLTFLAVGALANVHPSTAANLTLVLLAVYLTWRRFRPAGWAMAIACGLAATAGALLPLGYYVGLRAQLEAGVAATGYAAARDAFAAAGADLLYPSLLAGVFEWLPWAGALLLIAAVVLIRTERFGLRDRGTWLTFLLAALLLGLGVHGGQQAWAKAADVPPPFVELAQAAALAMLPLYVLVAQAVTNLFRLARRRRAVLRGLLAAVMVLWLTVETDSSRYLRHRLYDGATAWMKPEDRPEAVRRHALQRGRWRELRAIGRWMRDPNHTSAHAVVLCTRPEVRTFTRRSLVVSRADLKYIYHLRPGRLDAWVARLRRADQLLSPAGGPVNATALKAWREELRTEPLYDGAGPWYLVLGATAALDPAEGLEEIPGAGWGEHVRLWRLH